MPVALLSLRQRGPWLLAALVGAAIARAAPLTAPIYLDAAPKLSTPVAAAMLTPHDSFDAPRGFGWTVAPTETFAHPEFGGVRTAPLLDGVAGADFTLRLDLRAGRWTLLVLLDDGFRDAHSVAIDINGRPARHNPRVFGVEAEPDAGAINRFRVAQFVISANGPVDVRFRQPAPHGARLLALHALPMDWSENAMTRWFGRQIADAGRHDFGASLDVLRSQLGQFAAKPDLAACCAYWKTELDLLAEAERLHRLGGWDDVSLQTRSSMFTRYKIAVSLLDPLVEHPDGEGFPLRDRALWLRARLLYWLWLEQHMVADSEALAADLAVLRKKFPDDALIAMYAGEKIATPGAGALSAPHPNAPAWSAAQLEALQRLRDVAHYWVDQRQIPNGEFGGKTDDDVELLRWWPVLMFSGDRKAREGFRKLGDGVWFSPRMHEGYSKVARDVEHSSEFVADTVPLLALVTLDPEWISRLGYSYRYMRELWTGRNARGELAFKSAWLGATEILVEAPRNRDVSMNARAAKAVRYHAWLTGDAAASRLLHDWSLMWANAAARTDKGKPRGLFPASIRWPDGAVNGDEPSWHESKMFWDYYDWTGDGRLYDQLLFSWLDTHDAKLLEPLTDTLALLEKHVPSNDSNTGAAGSAAAAVARLMRSGEFWNVVTQWRLETNDARFDVFLRQHGPAYLRYRLTGDSAPMAETIESSLLSVLRFNRPMRTTEVLFTDRVFVSRREGGPDGADLLAAMLTGCHTAQGMSPYYHVAWEEAPAAFTALVTSTGSDHVAADLFIHHGGESHVAASFLRLPPGDYRVSARMAGRRLIDRTERITGRGQRVRLDIPGGAVVSIRVEAANERP